MDVHVTEQDGMAVLRMDDGAVNALSFAAIAALHEAIDGLDDGPFVLTGNERALSAGLDRNVFADGVDALAKLLEEFGGVTRRIWLHPAPVVVAASGHAIAGGTFLALVGDWTIATEGEFTWGMTETSIGLTIPRFALSIARTRIRRDRLDRLALGGVALTPAQAAEYGFADEVVDRDRLLPRAVEKATELAALARGSYAETKRRLRAAYADVDDGMAREDIEQMLASSPLLDGVR